MSQPLTLRSAPSGGVFVGDADGDALIWDAALQKWRAGAVVGGVASVFGRVGVVVAATGDYDSDQIDNLSSVSGASVSDALDTLALSAGAVASVYGRTGVVVAVPGDYDSDQITNESTVSGATVSDALDTLALTSGNVDSVFGRTGTVAATTNDYTALQVQNDSSVAGTGVKGALNALLASIAGLVTGVSSAFGRTGAVVATTNDYAALQVQNDSSVSGTGVKGALNALLASIAGLVTGVSSAFGRTGAVVATTNDYAALQVQNDSSVSGTGVKGALNTLLTTIAGLVTGVSSAFGRTGAVVATAGDYTTTLVTNSSNVPGATGTAALNYFAQAAAAVAGGATPALPFATNRYQKLTLSANAVPTMTVPPAGVECFLEVIQPAAGGPFGITTWPATVDWSVAGIGGGVPTLSTVANAIDLYRFISDGTRLRGAFHGEY